MRRSALFVFSALCVLPSASARAESSAPTPSAEATDQAREHFQRGVDFYKEQSFDAALAEFTRAYELAANYRVLFNLGQVQLERHDYVAALKSFRSYLDAGGADISDQRREQVERDVTTLKARVAELQIKCDVPGAEVLLEGVSAGSTPLAAPLLLNPGVVHVSVRKPGYASETRSLTLAGSETKELSISLRAESSARTEPSAEPTGAAPSSSAPAAAERSHAPVWVSLAITGAFAAGAGVFALRTHNANTALDRELDTYPGNASRISDARSTLKGDALATDLLSGGALVAAGFTLYFALSSPEHSSSSAGVGLRSLASARGVEVFGNF